MGSDSGVGIRQGLLPFVHVFASHPRGDSGFFDEREVWYPLSIILRSRLGGHRSVQCKILMNL